MIGVKIKVAPHNVPALIERDVEKLEKELAYLIVEEARNLIDNSIPSGRLYRRGRFDRRNRFGGVRASGRGTRIHRASAPGQPPAKDSGETYRKISARRVAGGKWRVRFGGAAGYLEFGTRNMAPRPFMALAIQKAVDKVFNGTKL